MADFNDEVESFREALRRTREVTEDDILAREGYARNQDGILGKIESSSKRRADIEEKIYKQIEATFGKEEALANKKLRSQEKQQEVYERQVESMGYTIKSNGELVKSTIELTNEQKKTLATLKDANEKTQKLAKMLEAPGKAFNDLSSRLSSTKAILGEFSNNILDSTKHSMGLTAAVQLASAAFEGVFNATKVMTKSLYEGERGAKVGAKAISELAESIGTAMQGIGAAMMFIPGLGIVAKVAGGAIALLGASAKLAAEANKVAAEQNDKLFDSFNKLSEAGLTTAAGITGVFETVQTLGMTTAELEKFNEMLMSSAKDLKMFGGTTAAGAKQFAEVAGELTKSAEFGEKLAQMGVTADAQREHTLKYMAQQTRLGLMQEKNTKDLIRGASAYIEELDKMAMLTGATRKEQEEAQNAINAIEEIRAAMEDAANRGDKVEQARLKKYYDLSVDLQQQGLTRGAGGVAKLGAAGGGPTDEASSAAYIQFSKALDAIKEGKSREEVLLEAAKGSKEQMRELAAAKAVGSDLSGLQTDKTGTNIDFYNRILKANEEATKQNISLSDYLKKEADAKTGPNADARTKDNVEATRMQQAAAQQLDSVVWTFNAAAKLNKTASDTFNSAVNKFNNTVGANPVAGGNIKTNVTGVINPESELPSNQPAAMVNTGGGAATGNSNLTRQSSRARNTPVRSTNSTSPVPIAPNAPPNAGAATMGSMAEQRRQGLGGASQGIPTPLPSNMTPKMTDSILNFGSNSGSKSNFEQLSDSIRNRIITAATEFNSMTGSKISINSAKRDSADQKRLWDESVQAGRTGLTAQGRQIAKPGSSKHERGVAVDIQNYDDPAAVKAMNSQGLFQTVPNDPVHFEMARFGGVFSGPTSGYPVMLHGEEVAMPKPQFDELSNSVKKESVTNAFTESNNMSTSNSTESSSAILQELLVLMENKFDSMIDKLSTSNDISDKLLRNSMV